VPKNYYISQAPYPSEDSIFTLITEDVFPKLVYNASLNPNRLSNARIDCEILTFSLDKYRGGEIRLTRRQFHFE